MLNDLTVGKPSRILLKFSLPLMLSTAIQQLYNIADSMIAGNPDSANGLYWYAKMCRKGMLQLEKQS